jgi:ubiquinone/menaquinone biosynthesis C-methylase UbiE
MENYLGTIIIRGLNKVFNPQKEQGRESRDAYSKFQFNEGKINLDSFDISIKDNFILDVGCGTGGKTVYYGLNGAKGVVGVDIDKCFIEGAVRFAEKKGASEKTEFIKCDASFMPFSANTFDIIMINDTIEHVSNPEKFLKECKRVLKPNGLICINFPPYFSSRGAHVYDFVYIPWCQVFFTEKCIINAIKNIPAQFYSDEFSIDDFRLYIINQYINLNKMTIKKFNTISTNINFEVKQFKLMPLMRYVRPLLFFPFIKEFLTTQVVCVLKKPEDVNK